MQIIEAVNVGGAWSKAVDVMQRIGQPADSRAGRVLVAPYPVMTVYERPCERVLFDPVRDANPFFHFFESLWMLAGRDDAAFLDQFVKDFGARFAEPGDRIHGAYGKRWRSGFGFDQLGTVVDKLRKNPDDRQCVIQMWDAGRNDGWDDLEGPWRDRPCNTHVFLRVRQIEMPPEPYGAQYPLPRVIDLTVCCRSNDIVWGAYGANAVHFSVLHEYLAGRIGVGMGKMYQFSNNWHAYQDVWAKVADNEGHLRRAVDRYRGPVSPMPIGDQWHLWDEDLNAFMRWAGNDRSPGILYTNKWFSMVAEPLYVTHMYWRNKAPEKALRMVEMVEATDWRVATREWMKRRMK